MTPLSDIAAAPAILPPLSQLRPCDNLLAVFEDCHNHIYANEGLLKEKIFHEIVKLLLMKLGDERHPVDHPAQFGITEPEREEILRGIGNNSFTTRLQALFAAVKREHPALFAADSGPGLKPATLAYVASKLQPYSLTSTPGDVKGKAFQTFVGRHQRGARGEFFTPHPIVQLAVAMTDPQPGERVIDPCCGSGGFLLQAIARLPEAARADYIATRVRGLEFNPDVVQAAMLQLAFAGGTGEEIICRNALADLGELHGAFDIVLTNPPFGTKGKVTDPATLRHYDLAHRWRRNKKGDWEKTAALQPGQTPDVLFLEQSLKLLRPDGRLAVVLPDGILQNATAGYVRTWLKHQAEIRAIISLPPETFLPYGTGIKTSLVILQKRPVTKSLPCFMAQVNRVGYDIKGQPIFLKDPAGNPRRDAAGELIVDSETDAIAAAYAAFQTDHRLPESETVFTVAPDQIHSRLDVEHYLPHGRQLVEELASGGAKRLGDLAQILSGVDEFRQNLDEIIRYIAIANIDAGTMQVVSQQEMPAHEAPSRASYRLQAGDIVTAIAGANTGTSRQATALITEEEAGAICSNGLGVLRGVHGIDPLFLLAYMRTGSFLKQVRRRMTGHAIPALPLEELAEILVPIPPKEKQEEIARAFAHLQKMRRDALKAGEALVQQTEHLLEE